MLRWALHSSQPTTALELRKELEAAVSHYDRQLDLRYARNMIAKASDPTITEPQERGPHDYEVRRQMKAGIDAAVAMATGMIGDLFMASITGHYDPINRDGTKERMAVFVDIARPDPVISEPMPPANPPIGMGVVEG